jgi:hypothetical protein
VIVRRVLPLLLVAALSLAVAGCGSSSSSSGTQAGGAATPQTSSTIHFAKTKFLLHAGLAFGVFHHFIYKPYKSGVLKHPLLHKLAFVKAALAGLFVVHEIKLAIADARASKLLSKLIAPLAAVGGAVTLARAALTHGQVNAGSINYANTSAAQASSLASAAGQPIAETTAGSGL